MRRRDRLEDGWGAYPDGSAAQEVLDRLPAITSEQLTALADRWTNPPAAARARSRALSPDVPRVVELLDAFETVSVVFADDLRGAPHLGLDRATAAAGVKAVRDALAGTVARPVLRRSEHRALVAPWRAVFGSTPPPPVDRGPHGATIAALIAALTQLSRRCHDPVARSHFEHLALMPDEYDAETARREAWGAAVATGRHRTSLLLRRQSAVALRPHCGASRDDTYDEERVRGRAADAAQALLVADALPGPLAVTLTAPLASLVPLPRTAAEG